MCALVKINYFSNIRKIVNFFFLYFDLFFRGKVVCDNILCPNPTCAQPFLPEGECCPICNNTVKAIQPGNKKEWNWFDEKKKNLFLYFTKKNYLILNLFILLRIWLPFGRWSSVSFSRIKMASLYSSTWIQSLCYVHLFGN